MHCHFKKSLNYTIELLQKIGENSQDFYNKLYNACRQGKTSKISELLDEESLENKSREKIFADALEAFGGTSLLHVATRSGQKDVIVWLLEAGSDPALRDAEGKTAYSLAPNTDVRNIYRRFMADNPDRYDYARAGIPAPLTAELEAARSKRQKEKKKSARLRKKEQEKLEAQKSKQKEDEERERARFLALSDREKRALAAERRILKENPVVVLSSRCFQCALDISDKTPFEYDSNKFCSTACVKIHRSS